MASELISAQDAARRLGTNTNTLQMWRHRKQGPPYVKVGRSVKYDPDVLDQWIEERTVYPARSAS